MSRTKKETTIFWIFDCPENPRLHSIILCVAAVLSLDLQVLWQLGFKLSSLTKNSNLQVDIIIPLVLMIVGFFFLKKHQFKKDMNIVRQINEEKNIDMDDEDVESFVMEFTYATRAGFFLNILLLLQYLLMYITIQFGSFMLMGWLF